MHGLRAVFAPSIAAWIIPSMGNALLVVFNGETANIAELQWQVLRTLRPLRSLRLTDATRRFHTPIMAKGAIIRSRLTAAVLGGTDINGVHEPPESPVGGLLGGLLGGLHRFPAGLLRL